jgi:hypothetical protein
MKTLNCAVGDLAITVNCGYEKNLGNIVRIISALGFETWACHKEPIYTWNVEIATEHGLLHYKCEDGEIRAFKSGPVPDCYLRRLTPPKDYLLDEFSDSDKLDLDVHSQNCIEES